MLTSIVTETGRAYIADSIARSKLLASDHIEMPVDELYALFGAFFRDG